MDQPKLRDRLDQARQRLLIDAAEIAFLRQGIAATSMADIAQEAGCSKRTLYHHFASKQELISEVMLRGFTILIDRCMEAQSRHCGDGALEQLKALAQTLFNFAIEFPEYFRTIAEFEPDPTDRGIEEESIVMRSLLLGEQLNAVLVAVIAGGIEEGIFRSDLDPNETSLALWLSVQGFLWMVGRKASYLTQSHQSEAKELFVLVVDLFVRGLLCKSTVEK